MRSLLVISFPILLVVAIVQISGCMNSVGGVSAEVLAKHQTRLVLSEEPEESLQTVADVRNTLLGITEEPHDHDHADHDHDEHADHDHEGHDHDAEEHAGHDHEGHDHDAEEHADHDHDEHADHDHDHGEHGHDDHEDHDHASLPTEPMEVVMVGTVGGLTNPWEEMQPDYPFASNQAMLFVCDSGTVAAKEASGHVHAPGEECAFCAAHAADTSDMIAMVRFLGEQGKVLPFEANQLCELKSMDTVVIKGTARVNKAGMLVVDAYGIYVRE